MHAINMSSECILLYVMYLTGIIPYNFRRKELSLMNQYLRVNYSRKYIPLSLKG